MIVHVRGLFINYWDSVNKREHGRDTNLILHDWRHQLLFLFTCEISIIWIHSADRREHKKSITWMYAEHSDVENVTPADYNGVNAIPSQIYTPFNRMHFIWHWTHLSYTYVQLISEVHMLLQCCFAVQYPSQSIYLSSNNVKPLLWT